MVCCLLPALGLGRERVCNREGSDSELSVLAVAHLAHNRNGGVALLSNKSLTIIARSTGIAGSAGGGMRSGQMTVSLRRGEGGFVKSPLLSCGCSQQDLGSSNPHGHGSCATETGQGHTVCSQHGHSGLFQNVQTRRCHGKNTRPFLGCEAPGEEDVGSQVCSTHTRQNIEWELV